MNTFATLWRYAPIFGDGVVLDVIELYPKTNSQKVIRPLTQGKWGGVGYFGFLIA